MGFRTLEISHAAEIHSLPRFINKYQKILKGVYKNNQKGVKHYCFTLFTNHIPIHTSASAMISSMPKEEVSPKNAKERSTLKIGLVNE